MAMHKVPTGLTSGLGDAGVHALLATKQTGNNLEECARQTSGWVCGAMLFLNAQRAPAFSLAYLACPLSLV